MDNFRIWGSNRLHQSFEKERYSTKFKICCGLPKDQVIAPVFFASGNINVNVLGFAGE